MRAICAFWIAFNILWLMVAFVLLALKGSVVISEPRPWLAWVETGMCFLSLPALAYIILSRRD